MRRRQPPLQPPYADATVRSAAAAAATVVGVMPGGKRARPLSQGLQLLERARSGVRHP
jgi:hypothetical protein